MSAAAAMRGNPIRALLRIQAMDVAHTLQSKAPSDPGGTGPSRPHLRLVVPTSPTDEAARAQLDDWMVAVATRHDREAFASLFRHFAPRLKGWLWRTGSPGEEAEELTQDAFVLLWRKAAQFNPERATVGAWLFTIARNLRVDRRRAVHDTWTTLDDSEVEGVADAGIGQEAELSKRQYDERVRAAMLRLTPDQRTLVQLSFYEDMSHSRIAAELKMPLGTVKTRLRSAASCLRNLLQECRP